MKKLFSVLLAAVLMTSAATAFASDKKQSAEELVSKAVYTVEKMSKHPQYSKWIHEQMQNAKAVLVVPQMLKGGFIIGGEGGSGVLLARADNGEWSYPAFYTIGAGSIGLQIGAQASEILFVVRNGKGLSAVLRDKVKLGGELNAAAGPVGAGVEASSTTNVDADIYSYSIAKGAFIGASFEGSVIAPDKDRNEAYYGPGARNPEDIVLNGKFSNPQADKLRETLRDFNNQ